MLLAAFFTLVLCASVETIHRRNEEPAEGRRMQQWNSSFPDDWTPGEIFYDAPGDHSWGISRMIGILTMQGGFALLEAGSVRLSIVNLSVREPRETSTLTRESLRASWLLDDCESCWLD